MSFNKKSFKSRLAEAGIKQWIKFSLVVLIIFGFLIWTGALWLLLLLPLTLDVYITKYVSWSAWKKSENKTLRTIAEWVDAIVFALVAVYIINLFFFQNYKIPSPSLEKTLMVGDFLFVSKMSYGPRCPMTPLSFPLAQHTLPGLNTKSYLEWLKCDYKRLTGLGNVERNDIVVFNFPAGDTVALKIQNPDYYSLVHQFGRDAVWNDKNMYGDIVVRPVDRRENYVKRCVAIHGDSLQIIDGVVYINGKKSDNFEGLQHNYFVETKTLISEKFFDDLGVRKQDRYMLNMQTHGIDLLRNLKYADSTGNLNYVYRLPLTKKAYEKLSRYSNLVSIKKEDPFFGGKPFPLNLDKGWTRDNYGPIWIPKKGETIKLTLEELPLYKQIIGNYEGNKLEVKGDQIFINGKPATTYTFSMDYYWMMGDNRHNSADSRFWGYVPEDHIVGKPIFIWLSLDEDKPFFSSIRWNRIFSKVHAD